MGIAATQARLLALQNREANVEFFASQINQQKIDLKRTQEDLSKTWYTKTANKVQYIEDKAEISAKAYELAKQDINNINKEKENVEAVKQKVSAVQAKALAAYKVFSK